VLVADARRARSAGQLPAAAALLERVLARNPDHLDALQDYALLALGAGKPQAAAACAARWGALQPGSAEALVALGVAQRQCGRLAEAVASLTRAVALAPDMFDARMNLGNVLLDSATPVDALPHYQRALEIQPTSPSAHNNLGNLHRELRKPTEALAAYRRALELDPAHAWAWNNVGNILKDFGDTEAAIEAFRRSLALAPDRSAVWSNLLLTMNASDQVSPAALAEAHRAYGRHFSRLLPALPPIPLTSRAGRRLRVGFVSADFRRHAVATFFLPLLAAIDRARLEVFCYYNQARGDEVTARIKEAAEHFVPVAGLADRALAERIRRDGIDILVDLGGHTADNRLPLFFLRPAPVQALWLGYLGSSGVPSIDWRITDVHAEPEDAVASDGLEPPWRLPRTLWCYASYPESPETGDPPCASSGVVTFGCLNNPGKVAPTILAAWLELLHRVPASRLILLTSPDAGRAKALRDMFAQSGIAADRLDLVARMPVADYLRVYSSIDIALDTWPWTGGTTTCDALWMGVPVVTLAGDHPFARSGATILAQLGLADLVTRSTEAYVACATALATDRARLRELRHTLRARMQASPLMDAKALARDVEDALFRMLEERQRVVLDSTNA
jgi:predicted O-linked N-acetylglucosamine transferase (SPINDLY family)